MRAKTWPNNEVKEFLPCPAESDKHVIVIHVSRLYEQVKAT